ncbi:MAG TPA: sulfate permease [Pseudomonas sp.]|uniref:SulP family inorganic anion transporter n=1 Tax=Pseudomonas sp. TaxID=306 RepID=UPI002BB5E2AF|nr:sulfate permease [Pseudomonas sp.]HRL93082.1 sulfate permease [Pseudomonas sp.]
MLTWLKGYRRELLAGDLGAGVLVVLMLVPQGMAYALVAGLPPVAGLYASILPVLAYALFGSSMVQSVGPMAITSLMTATSLATLAPSGSELYGAMAAQMALISGVVLVLCGVLRLGFLSSFLSRPVMSGFTSGAALVIAASQLKVLLGGPLTAINPTAAGIGLLSLLLLWLARSQLGRQLQRLGLAAKSADMLSKLAPAAILLLATLLVWQQDWQQAGVALIGPIPAGLPSLGLSLSLEQLRILLAPSLLIGFMVFLSGQSAAVTLAQRRGERINTNQELLGLGAANVASALSGGFPVTGSISRSAVNYAAGANTPLASVLTALLLAVLLVTPNAWLAWLPLPALAATIIIAVFGMLDLTTPREAWRYDRADAVAWLVTFSGVLLLGVEEGVMLGVVLSLGTVIWRASRPHIAVLGRLPGSEHFRNIERYAAETHPQIVLLRIDAGVFFGNAELISDRVLQTLTGETRHLVLVMTAINLIDTTGLYALAELNQSLATRGIKLHLAEVKGPLMDKLKHSDLLLKPLSGQVFISAVSAFDQLSQELAAAPVQA